MQFTGLISARTDSKGRVFFPSVFRKQLPAGDMSFVLKRDIYEPCLVVYPQEIWDAEVDALTRRLNRWNRREAMVLRRFLSEVETFVLDANGRMLLPRRLMEAAGIDKEVLFAGVGDRIEIWSKTRCPEAFMSDEDYGRAVEELMGGTSLPVD